MKRITNRVVTNMGGSCERCHDMKSRVLYTVTAENGGKEHLCESCVSKDDNIE